MYNKIKDSLYMGQKDYKFLKLRCYLCDKKKDHISIDCTLFRNIAGNLKKNYMKLQGNEQKKKKKRLQALRINIDTDNMTQEEEQTDEECESPLFFKNNPTAPRQSPKHFRYKNHREDFNSSSREDSDDSSSNNSSDHEQHHDYEDQGNNSASEVSHDEQEEEDEVGDEEEGDSYHLHNNNNVLEDIKEDQSLEVSGSDDLDNRPMTPKQKPSTNNMQNMLFKRASTNVIQIHEHHHRAPKIKISNGNTGSFKTSKMSEPRYNKEKLSPMPPIN